MNKSTKNKLRLKRVRHEYPTYIVHMNTRLTEEQADAVRATGLTDSEALRTIVQQWIDNTIIHNERQENE